MILLEALETSMDPKGVAAMQTDKLKEMKKTNPIINYETMENNGEVILDFLVTANGPDGKVSVVEHNLYRYITQKVGKKSYVVLLGISKRSYGEDIRSFLMGLRDTRTKSIESISTFQIPAIYIQ